ncbi:STM4015 family protein [Paenibacillus sp. GCM10012307]|uniref:STM4015 family protein n=1 Tax=Paenibacillus roseus TaxID=2798579 RepID=A0A934J998_9BACL|nr:STM4015 family protein [Paenibacillus roseus]MBJ6362705.1 STM4015 family protein [Paenibacillus roseus]
MAEIRLTIDYDSYESGQRMDNLINELAQKPESGTLTALTIGDWGEAYQNSPDTFLDALIRNKDSFPQLRKLFIGDMSFEDCEVSWIVQSDLTPVLQAFPKLQSFIIKGSTGLALPDLEHDALEELVIICGGLPLEVVEQIRSARLPELKKLELYLGVEDYGFDGKLEDILPFLEQGRFPKLTYLGLKDSDIQDEIAKAAANAPILDQLHILDLSLGTLSDEGAEALINSERVRKLAYLDLNYHYMSDEMIQRWKATGMNVNVDDQRASDDEDDWRYPALTE